MLGTNVEVFPSEKQGGPGTNAASCALFAMYQAYHGFRRALEAWGDAGAKNRWCPQAVVSR